MARNFNGSTDRIDWASVANLTGSALTISLWAYADTYVANGYLVCIHDSGDASFGIIVNTSSADPSFGYVSFLVNGSTDLQRAAITGTLTTGVWTHLLITWTGGITAFTNVHIYKNGVETSYSTGANGASETTHSGSWSLGGRIYDDARNFDGRLGEVAVWDRVLSADEIAQLAAGYTPGYLSSGLQFYWSGDNNSLVATPGGTGTADGTSDYTTNYPAITYPATLTGRATITATGTVNGTSHSAAATITGRASIIATGTATSGSTAHSVSATLAGRASVIATGRRAVNASAILAGDANLTVTPYVLIDDIILEWTEVSATLSGRATLTGSGTNTVPGVSTISGRATVTATATVINNASATLTGRASIIATGQAGRQSQATIQGRATLTATGTIVGKVEGVATIPATATVIATGQVGHDVQATISADANVIATGTVTVSGTAVIVGSATLSATGTVTTSTTSHSAIATLAGYATVTVSGLVTVNGAAIITASANLQGTPPTKGTGERTVLHLPTRDTLYMPAREDVIIDG